MQVPRSWELRFWPYASKYGDSVTGFVAYRGASSLGVYKQLYEAIWTTTARGVRRGSSHADLASDLARQLLTDRRV